MNNWIKVDFHCHSNASPDSINGVQQLIELSKKRGLDRLVITDHNRLSGAIAAKELDPEFVIVGEEIMTTKGEILAAYVKEEIPRNLAPQKVIDLLRQQDSFISVSHPFDPHRGWDLDDLLQIAGQVDAVEIYNARCSREEYNVQAADFALEHGLGGTVGSDSHTPFEIGRVGLELPLFNNAAELKSVIRQGRVQGTLSSKWVHLVSGTKGQIHKMISG